VIVIWECELKTEKRAETLESLLLSLRKNWNMNFIDLFSGAGGLSDGKIMRGRI